MKDISSERLKNFVLDDNFYFKPNSVNLGCKIANNVKFGIWKYNMFDIVVCMYVIKKFVMYISNDIIYLFMCTQMPYFYENSWFV